MKQPWDKLGLTELSYLLAYSQGYKAAFIKDYDTTYKTGTALRKAFNKGKRDAKKY
jgi:hypothetical protein